MTLLGTFSEPCAVFALAEISVGRVMKELENILRPVDEAAPEADSWETGPFSICTCIQGLIGCRHAFRSFHLPFVTAPGLSAFLIDFFPLQINFFSFQLLNRKDKTTFEKLDYLMSKEDNYKRTRDYIRSLKMVPSIPYLGTNLSWLILLLTSQAT